MRTMKTIPALNRLHKDAKYFMGIDDLFENKCTYSLIENKEGRPLKIVSVVSGLTKTQLDEVVSFLQENYILKVFKETNEFSIKEDANKIKHIYASGGAASKLCFFDEVSPPGVLNEVIDVYKNMNTKANQPDDARYSR